MHRTFFIFIGNFDVSILCSLQHQALYFEFGNFSVAFLYINLSMYTLAFSLDFGTSSYFYWHHL